MQSTILLKCPGSRVEITAAEANMPAVSAWYQEEHMPGLAAVPGCVHAQRFLTHGREPVSVACYDIADAGIRETAAWNDARHGLHKATMFVQPTLKISAWRRRCTDRRRHHPADSLIKLQVDALSMEAQTTD